MMQAEAIAKLQKLTRIEARGEDLLSVANNGRSPVYRTFVCSSRHLRQVGQLIVQ